MQYKGNNCCLPFTLLELLLVIAVIVILASLLLPALSSAKERTRTIACAQQLKQIGLAVHMYANDNNGWKPQDPQVANFGMLGRDNSTWGRCVPSLIVINGYLGPNTTIAMNFFKCPLDEFWWYHRDLTTTAPGGRYISYYYYCVYPGYWGLSEKYSRNRITDNPGAMIFSDTFPMQGQVIYNHKKRNCNILYLGGYVKNLIYTELAPYGVSNMYPYIDNK